MAFGAASPAAGWFRAGGSRGLARFQLPLPLALGSLAGRWLARASQLGFGFQLELEGPARVAKNNLAATRGANWAGRAWPESHSLRRSAERTRAPRDALISTGGGPMAAARSARSGGAQRNRWGQKRSQSARETCVRTRLARDCTARSARTKGTGAAPMAPRNPRAVCTSQAGRARGGDLPNALSNSQRRARQAGENSNDCVAQ